MAMTRTQCLQMLQEKFPGLTVVAHEHEVLFDLHDRNGVLVAAVEGVRRMWRTESWYEMSVEPVATTTEWWILHSRKAPDCPGAYYREFRRTAIKRRDFAKLLKDGAQYVVPFNEAERLEVEQRALLHQLGNRPSVYGLGLDLDDAAELLAEAHSAGFVWQDPAHNETVQLIVSTLDKATEWDAASSNIHELYGRLVAEATNAAGSGS